MHAILRRYIETYAAVSLSFADDEKLKRAFIPKGFSKGEFLHRKGEVCWQIGFIAKGAIRLYTLNQNGAEHIVRLGIENWWAGDLESFTSGKPSLYYSDVLELSDVLLINLADFRELQATMPAFAAMLRVLDEKSHIAAQRRVYLSQTATAEEKYADLKNKYPSFLQRFSQKTIAAYLGMSPETLSRIRSRDNRNRGGDSSVS